MKSILFFSILIAAFANTCFAQFTNSKNLQFIKDFRIKLDGGCSFYTYDSTPIDANKYIFIISAKQVGFINVSDEYVYLKNTKNIKLNNHQYKKIFKGNGYDIVLDIRYVGKFDSNDSLYEGSMQIKYKNSFQYLKIHGKVANL
ncbi:MAG: hypothetical protein JST87_08235 [Bacteroidetes bacterium]|nr:hypothetical protein [Bacteroidota bacterium]